MPRDRMYLCCLWLVLIVNSVEATLRRVHQYRRASSNDVAPIAARCVKRATSFMFSPSNRVVVIVSNRSLTNDSSLTDDVVGGGFSNAANPLTVASDFVQAKDPTGSRIYSENRDSSYLIIENTFKNLFQTFRDEELSAWAEYLILTRINVDVLATLATSLRRRGFLRFAFLHVEPDDAEDPGSLTLYDSRMRVLMTCDDGNSTMTSNSMGTNTIGLFSRFTCPAKGCQVTVGQVRNDMVGSAQVAKSRRVVDTGDHVVSYFVGKASIDLKNRSLENWTDALEAVARDNVDVIYGSFIPSTEGLEMLDIAAWFGFEKVIFFDHVHIIHFAPLTKIFNPLDAYVWLCVLVCLAGYWAFAMIVQNFHQRRMIRETIEIFDVWAILLGQSVRSPDNVGLRGILSMWMITALLVTAAYGSAFKSSLAEVLRLKPLKTLDDVGNSGRRVVGAEVAERLFRTSSDENDRLIYDKWRLVEPAEVFPVAIKNYDVGVDYDLNVRVHNLVKRERRARLYTLDEPILVFPINFYLKKRHPFLRAFRWVVSRAAAAGLTQKWYHDDVERIELRSTTIFARRFKWNRMSHLSNWHVCFKLWAAGNFVAFVRLLYEIRKFRRESEKKNTPPGAMTRDLKISKDLRRFWRTVTEQL